MPSRVPLPLWTIQWRPSLETTDADLRPTGSSFWFKSMHLLPHFYCLENAAIQGKCCHSNMRSNFGILFSLGLSGEQRRQKSLNETESLSLWKEKVIWKNNHLFSTLSIFLQANGFIIKKDWRKKATKSDKPLQRSVCLQAMQQAKLYPFKPTSIL